VASLSSPPATVEYSRGVVEIAAAYGAVDGGGQINVPATVADSAVAWLPSPPPTVALRALAVLIEPPATVEASPLAVLLLLPPTVAETRSDVVLRPSPARFCSRRQPCRSCRSPC
jgi:hypothetical protein